ncbi:MAG: YbjQ family protein [Planctomycetes bacterium]|nr:YbjQ family protein [Planctomycetota bacterium]
MENLILVILYTATPLVLLLLGLIVGGAVESAHFRRLDRWEQDLSGIMMSDMKHLPPNWRVSDAVLVSGEAVMATDYFKVFSAGLRNLFGGRVRGYEKLMERARREAIVRMLRQAQHTGANVVWNVRLETSTIQGKQQKKSGGVEVLAYGTALKATGG